MKRLIFWWFSCIGKKFYRSVRFPWMQSVRPQRALKELPRKYNWVVATHMFFYVHPETWGRFSSHFEGCIFFKWVGEKPPTR